MPGRDTGLALVGPSTPSWTPIKGGTTDTITLAEHGRIQRRWNAQWTAWQTETVFEKPVEYSSQLAVADNLFVDENIQAVNGKWLFSGTAGHRAFGANFRAIKRASGRETWATQIKAYFDEAKTHDSTLPSHDGTIAGLDVVIEARNLSNYFHFVRETLPTIAMVACEKTFTGRIKIVTKATTLPSFVQAHIATLFPELKDRVDLVQTPSTFDRALIVWHGDIAYFGNPTDHIPNLIGPKNDLANNAYPSRLGKVLMANGNIAALRKLRERALDVTDGISFNHLPNKFWLGRRAARGHDRSLKNEAALLDLLYVRGFQQVLFEDLTPLAQIGAMQNADIMLSYHGAGFTNMAYAAAKTHVIELGTLQTGTIRWDDFASLAHLSGCRYTVAIADYEYDGPEVIPPNRGKGLYPVRMSDHATDRLMTYLDGL